MRKDVENPELKPYIEEYVIKTLENCDLFVKVYGKGFVKQRLEMNFQKLYTEGFKSGVAGEYHTGRSGLIYIFEKGANGNLLTFKDLEEKGKLDTILHEAVHAIFNRTPEECQDLCKKSGSGIHEYYSNSVEMGRGLNEGYTNWVCEKAGLKTSSYYELTNFVKIIEQAVGPENVMKMGEGDITKKLPRLLQMEPQECMFLLSKADLICDYNYKSRDYKRIAKLLKEKNDFWKLQEEDPMLEMPSDLIEDLLELNRFDIYTNILSDEEYIKFADEHNLDPESDETKAEYCTNRSTFYKEKSKELEQEVHEELFSKYFIKELEDVINTKEFSMDQYKKFASLETLVYFPEEDTNSPLNKFQKNFEILKAMSLEKVKNELKEAIENKTLTANQIIEYKDIIVNGDYRKEYEFNQIVSEQLLPENPQIYRKLLERLSMDKSMAQLFDYRILELESQNGHTASIFLNKYNDNHFSNYMQTPTIIRANDEIGEDEDLFDITLTDLQSMQKIVKNFLELKDKICEKNPNAKIQIIDSLVMVSMEDKNPEFYMIEGNEFVSSKVKELKPEYDRTDDKNNGDKTDSSGYTSSLHVEELEVDGLSKMEEKSKNADTTSLEPVSKNPFKKLFMEIKKRLSRRETKLEPTPIMYDELTEEELDKIGIINTNFENSIHVENTPVYNPKQASDIKNEEKDAKKNKEELDI